MKKMKNDNKGFTLVELIVVLVILAILAAILVPALLGYIDEAKGKQIVLNAKSVYTAAQSVASEMYAKDIEPANAIKTSGNDKGVNTWAGANGYSAKIYKIADVASFGGTKYAIFINFKGDTDHDKWTVDKVYYNQDGKVVELINGSWETRADGAAPSIGSTSYPVSSTGAATSPIPTP